MKIAIELETRFRLEKLAASLRKTTGEMASLLLERGLQTADREAALYYDEGLQTSHSLTEPSEAPYEG